jgi:hypothetical protein
LRGGSKNLLAKLVGARPSTCARPSFGTLNDLEDYYLAAQRLKKNFPDIPLKEVECRLGLED